MSSPSQLRSQTQIPATPVSALLLLRCAERLRTQFHRARVHPHHLPVMPVEIVEAPAIHEAMILRRHRIATAGVDRFLYQLVDLISAATGQGDQRLGLP